MKQTKKLREGFTTGACAAAASMAACLTLLKKGQRVEQVEIDFPDGKKRTLKIEKTEYISPLRARASIIKDAGDDPDVTHMARIISEVEIEPSTDQKDMDKGPRVEIRGGEGVGIVTKPGLSVPPGEPAINPVPRMMIKNAVLSALRCMNHIKKVIVTIHVPNGKSLSQKTLNKRLGIVGGISILGTTGIVKPISQAAWCATISVSMDVALAVDLDTICLTTGRSSESALMKELNLKEEAFISMGDYVGYSLKEAATRPFKRIILGCQWSKLVKMAMGWDHTHVRFGALDPKDAKKFIEVHFGYRFQNESINTVRQMLGILLKEKKEVVKGVCEKAFLRLKDFLAKGQGIELYLISYDKRIIFHKKK